MAENDRTRTKVDDLRRSLGELAKEPMIALQLQELEAVEHVKDGFLPRMEIIIEELAEGGDADDQKSAARMGLKCIENYVKYNQRWNDTLKTLMAILKQREKQQGENEDEDALTAEQKYLLTGAKNESKTGRRKKQE